MAEAANGRPAVELAARHRPDIVVLDLTMPELNGLDAARQILADLPSARVLILTAHESEQLIREVLGAGAQGYVLKADAARILVNAVEALLDGRTFFTSKVAQLVLEGYLRSGGAEPHAMPALSAREREILQLLRAVCQHARAWRLRRGEPIRLAMNLSATLFRHQNLLELIRDALQAERVDAECLEIELTESSVMTNPEETASVLKQLRKMASASQSTTSAPAIRACPTSNRWNSIT